jgi:hypothetical protein
VVVGVTIIAHGVFYLTGDPTYLLIDVRGMTEDQIHEFRTRMGFDSSWIAQYAAYISRAVRGDLGRSLCHSLPITSLERALAAAGAPQGDPSIRTRRPVESLRRLFERSWRSQTCRQA